MTCQKYSWTPRVGKRKRWDWDQVQRLPEVDLSKFLLRRLQCTADLNAMKQSKENQFDSYFIVSNSHSPHFPYVLLDKSSINSARKKRTSSGLLGPFGFGTTFGTTTKFQEGAVGNEFIGSTVSIMHMGKRTREKTQTNNNTLQGWKIILSSLIKVGLSSFITPYRFQLPPCREHLSVWLKHLKGSWVPNVGLWH